MGETNYSGGPVMVKIDGSKIRRIREEKGLTQLYIATAVEVTTDTVSRWENKRYPSIKKENGVKLAQALEVGLEDILETEADEGGLHAAAEKVPKKPAETAPSPQPTSSRRRAVISKRTGLLLSLMFVPLFGVMVYFLFFSESGAIAGDFNPQNPSQPFYRWPTDSGIYLHYKRW